MIPVTKSFIPPLEEYTSYVKRAFDKQWLTNRGILVQELEEKLHQYLELKSGLLLATSNGTIPLQIALKLFGEEGEVITTPFSYVATTSAIVWEKCKPVFVDINPDYLTIDETKIEAAITDKTTCILATHVFGNPCHIEHIHKIAREHKLKVIYDAAHCFGVKYKGQSIFEYGDISTCSFHATKLFHTGEGGAVFCREKEIYERVFYSHNFGHEGLTSFAGLGINGKLSELQAAMGLSVLPYMHKIIEGRREVVDRYDQSLNFDLLKKMELRESTIWNYSYYPVIFSSEEERNKVQRMLNEKNIYPRRYFYPSLNHLPYIEPQVCKYSEEVASSILCLPLYDGLREEEQITIIETINEWV
jgi:dTDP-4-amino-4,6-dideoxygalactose transaminase